MTSQVPLTRSKSDIGTYDWSKELTREEMQKKCRALLKARLCVMDTSSCESFSEADSLLDTSASSFYELFPNDKRYRQLSSSPSSGFGDDSEENEVLSFSRTSSVFIPIAKTKARPKSVEVVSFDYDKDVETKLYSKSLEKSRRPSSIVRSQSFGRRQQSEGNDEKKADDVNDDDDNALLATDDDSESDDVKYKENNGSRKAFSPKIAAMVRERKQKRLVCNNVSGVTTTLNDITNNDNTKDFEDVTLQQNDVGMTDDEPTFNVIPRYDFTPKNDVTSTYDVTPAYDVIDITNDVVSSSPSDNDAKEDVKISLEQYVDKLSRTHDKKIVGRRKVVGKNIRIESVL